MFYINDFKITKSENKTVTKSINQKTNYIIPSRRDKINKNNLQYALVFAAKPLFLLATLLGSQLVRYNKYNIGESKWYYKLYSVLVMAGYLTINLVIRPASWHYTKIDHPLNVLTKSFGLFNIVEAMHSMFTISCCNTKSFVQLFKKIHDIDNHLGFSKLLFARRRCVSIFFTLMPILQVQSSFWLIKFDIQNIGVHVTLFLITLQGAMISFLVLNIFLKHVCLNKILAKRVRLTLSGHKDIIIQDSISDSILNIISKEPQLTQSNYVKYCWFELMQIYDKLADCIYLFNKIFSGQVFLMYNTWLLCTLLCICRTLSPSIKYSQVFLSDLNLYFCINSRPLFLAVICEMFIKERKRTLNLLLHILLMSGKEHAYFNQVETMIMLVKSRKLEISANVFTVNVPTVMNFAGRIISYTVLAIQYFYNYEFIK